MEQIYFCYVLLNPLEKGEFKFGELQFDFKPFYVGQGKGDRIKKHLYEVTSGKYNKEKLEVVKQIKDKDLEPLVYFVKENITQEQALKLEREIISLIGREDLGKGTLLNKTNGGEGEHKERLLENNPMHNPEIAEKFKGVNNSAYTHRETNIFVSNNPMKNAEIASQVNKARRAKVDPAKLSKAVGEANKNRDWSELSRLKLKLGGYRRYKNQAMIDITLKEIERLEKQG